MTYHIDTVCRGWERRGYCDVYAPDAASLPFIWPVFTTAFAVVIEPR
jgi:hypothetical protein